MYGRTCIVVTAVVAFHFPSVTVAYTAVLPAAVAFTSATSTARMAKRPFSGGGGAAGAAAGGSIWAVISTRPRG